MENAKRITPEEVIAAYKATGLKPMRSDYFPDHGCACALGALSYQHGIKDNDSASTFTEGEYGIDYRCGFANGFDGDDAGVECYSGDKEQFALGHSDGQAAWNAVIEAGLVGDAVE